jgi:acyl transferase domain-containing protein
MTDKTAFLFPGLGSHIPGSLTHLRKESAVVERTLGLIDTVAVDHGHPPVSPLVMDPGSPTVTELLAEDPDRLLLAIFATSVALSQMLDSDYGVRPGVAYGHSFGSFAALTAAGVLTVESGTEAACLFLECIRTASLPPSGMLAVELGAAEAEQFLNGLGKTDLVIALENTPRQTVVSGTDEALVTAEQAAVQGGVRIKRLPVPHGFHHPFMAPAVEQFALRMAAVQGEAPRTQVYSAVLDRYLSSGEDVAAWLSADVSQRLRFAPVPQKLHADGVRAFLECGARSVLSGLITDCAPSLTAHAPLAQPATSALLEEVLASLSADSGDEHTTTTTASARGTATSTLPQAEQLEAELRALYAEALEYPEDLVTADAELEAELGIDSLQQEALLRRALNRYGLTETNPRASEYPTLRAIAQLLRELAQKR